MDIFKITVESTRYLGAMPCRHWWTVTLSLNWICVMWRRCVDVGFCGKACMIWRSGLEWRQMVAAQVQLLERQVASSTRWAVLPRYLLCDCTVDTGNHTVAGSPKLLNAKFRKTANFDPHMKPKPWTSYYMKNVQLFAHVDLLNSGKWLMHILCQTHSEYKQTPGLSSLMTVNLCMYKVNINKYINDKMVVISKKKVLPLSFAK